MQQGVVCSGVWLRVYARMQTRAWGRPVHPHFQPALHAAPLPGHCV